MTTPTPDRQELHSPAPWTVFTEDGQVIIEDANGDFVTEFDLYLAVDNPASWEADEAKEMAAILRMLACVNACRDVPTEALEGRAFTGPDKDADPFAPVDMYALCEAPDHAE